MARVTDRFLLSAALCAVLAVGIAAPAVRAATGDVLVEFKSEWQTLPMEQGIPWTHNGECLRDTCPGIHYDPDPINHLCYYQGWWDGNTDLQSDNNCRWGTGCRKSSQPGSPGEHYNSPLDPAWYEGDICTYTEWIAFDDGNNQGDRLLTITDSTNVIGIPIGPPWGAPSFNHAPSYPVLRIVTGDGNLVPNSLPINQSPRPNNRNQGRAEVYRSFVVPPVGVTAVTLVYKAAAGPRSDTNEIVSVRVFGRRFSFGVGGDPATQNYGRFTYEQDTNGIILETIFTQSVSIAQPTGVSTPAQGGEFFTMWAILRADGSFHAYLEESGSEATGQVETVSSGDPKISLVPDTDDATVWIDYVKILEGEVLPPPPPPPCPDPVFNIGGINRDDKIDQTDMDAFFGCATGPANANGTWANLSPACQCMDVNYDQSIDMNDFGVLQRCITTGGGGLVPTCDD